MTDGAAAAGTATAGTEGAAGAATGEQQQTTQGQQAPGQQAAAGQQQQTQAQGQQQAVTGEEAAALAARFPGFATFPAEAQQALLARDAEARRYQREAGDNRINAKTTAANEGARKALAEVAKQAGLEIPGLTDADDGDPDPKALAAEITTAKTERDAARKEAATIKAAYEAKVDPAKLGYLQYLLSQNRDYQALALDADDFSAKLSSSINGLLAADATLRLTGTAQASGVEHLGGTNGSGEITPEQFARMSITDRTALYQTDKATYDRLVAAQAQ